MQHAVSHDSCRGCIPIAKLLRRQSLVMSQMRLCSSVTTQGRPDEAPRHDESYPRDSGSYYLL